MNPQKLKPFPAHVAIIGAGGVGSYLLPTLLRTIRNHAKPEDSPHVILIDGDKLEKRNMERQLFDDSDIGKFKADALREKYVGYYPRMSVVTEFFTGGEEIQPDTLLIVCVDNHPGRMRALSAANRANCKVILCGNGYTDAEAMFYNPAWQGTALDPLKYYPEIATTETGDPLQPAGCTGEAQQATPQLAIANYMAAAHALHLLWFWYQESDKMTGDFKSYSPVHHANNFTRHTTRLQRDLQAASS